MLITIINTSNPRNTDKNSTETQMQIYWQRIRQNSQNNTKPYNNHFLSLPNLGNVHMYMGSFYNWYLSKAWQSNRWHYNPNCTEISGNQKPKNLWHCSLYICEHSGRVKWNFWKLSLWEEFFKSFQWSNMLFTRDCITKTNNQRLIQCWSLSRQQKAATDWYFWLWKHK